MYRVILSYIDPETFDEVEVRRIIDAADRLFIRNGIVFRCAEFNPISREDLYKRINDSYLYNVAYERETNSVLVSFFDGKGV